MGISAKEVKKLRDQTGVGMMDCKKALEEGEGDFDKAVEILRKKGMAAAAKRSGRAVHEGLIEAYIHPNNRLGVLLEVNCETDFVAKTDDFHCFCRDVAMQIAAMNPLVVDRKDLPPEMVEKELEIYRTQARNQGKPEKIVDKIALGKLGKYYGEVCLMEQKFVKDSAMTIRDLIHELIAKLGENISIRRFTRYRLSE